MTKKLLILLIPLLALPAALRADEHTLIISFRAGSSTALLLRDKPSATFVDDELWVESGSFSAAYQRSDIAEFTFGWKDLTPIHALPQRAMQITYTDNDKVQVHGIPTTSTIGVYSLDGRRLTPTLTHEPNGITIDLTAYPAGTYLITINHTQTFKIIKK